MRTSDWALTISLLSFFVSLGGLAWNVWSKFIFPKPRFQVEIGRVLVFDLGEKPPYPSVVRLTATNHGPITCKLTGAVLRLRSADGRITSGIPNLLVHPSVPDHFELQAGFPVSLAVGDSHNAYFASGPETVFRRGVFRVGVTDGFGRNHWVSGKQFKQLVTELAKADPEAWTPEALESARMK